MRHLRAPSATTSGSTASMDRARTRAATRCSTCTVSSCPAAYESIVPGSLCNNWGSTCAYPRGTCTCVDTSLGVATDGGSGHTWHCYPATSSCVSPRPNIGTPCSNEGQSCDYGACADGVEIDCVHGSWQQAQVGCPMSAALP